MSAHSRKVTWPELFSDRPPINYPAILGAWSPRIVFDYEIGPIGMSAFGCIFFAKRDGTTQCLDPIKGSVRQVAADADDFRTKMNSESWQVENLHSWFVAQVVMNIPRTPSQAYCLAPHPNFTGGMSLQKSKVLAIDAVVWHSIAAQSF
jgi:hypothetical protein